MAQEKYRISSWIKKETRCNNFHFVAYCRNDSTETVQDLSYTFHSLKKETSGTSNISQSGKFEAEPGKKISLATVELDHIEDGMINVKLKIFHKDSLIAIDSLNIKP